MEEPHEVTANTATDETPKAPKTPNADQPSGGGKSTDSGPFGLPAMVELVLRVVLGGLFLYSGGAKLLDPAAFQTDIANFELIPLTLAGLVAVYLPWLEIACGAALIARRLSGGAVLILCILMLAFILFVASAWARGLDVTCGCFGASDSAPNYPLWIGRNLLIVSGLVAIPWLHRLALGGRGPNS